MKHIMFIVYIKHRAVVLNQCTKPLFTATCSKDEIKKYTLADNTWTLFIFIDTFAFLTWKKMQVLPKRRNHKAHFMSLRKC